MARKALSKSLRFEVFKRDSFTCQYCGQKSPQVVLEVDHIEPVSKGGTNDILNLVTSCFDCNRGKSDKKLDDDSVIIKQQEQLEEINERRVQLEMLLEWRKELSSLDDDMIKGLVSEIEAVGEVGVAEHGLKQLKKWYKKYEYDILLDSIEASFLQYEEAEKAFAMIPRIAYYKTNPEKQIDPRLFYIRGILRNRFSYIKDWEALGLIKTASNQLEIETIKELAISAPSWNVFKDDLEYLLNKDEGD